MLTNYIMMRAEGISGGHVFVGLETLDGNLAGVREGQKSERRSCLFDIHVGL